MNIAHDPVVLIWQKIAKKRAESEAILKRADAFMDAFCKKTGNDPEQVFEPSIECRFPDYTCLPDHGVATEEPMRATSETEVMRAIGIAKARASYYGESEMAEVEALGAQWLAKINEALSKALTLMKESGYAALEEQAYAIDSEAHALRERLLKIKAKSIQGVLLQVTEIIEYLHYNNYVDSIKQLKLIEAGLKNLQSKAALPPRVDKPQADLVAELWNERQQALAIAKAESAKAAVLWAGMTPAQKDAHRNSTAEFETSIYETKAQADAWARVFEIDKQVMSMPSHSSDGVAAQINLLLQQHGADELDLESDEGLKLVVAGLSSIQSKAA